MKRISLYILGLLAGPPLLFSNPEGARVVSGEASVQQTDRGTLHIHAGHGSILEWQSFSIDEGEKTRFIQPDSKSAVLNRVVGKEKSILSGKLESNGKVFLINPHGILVSKSGMINTGGFFAATHNLSDEEFLQQQEMSFKGSSKEAVSNYGLIEAMDGDVALIGHSVDNKGTIRAPKGEVFLGSGGEVILRPSGGPGGEAGMLIRLSEAADKSEEVGVHHAGAIEAIKATLKADGNLCALAINQEGTINATGVLEKDGQVFLVAEQGTVHMTGSIAAHNSDGSGGEVRLLGDSVGLVGAASVDVSGSTKGGTALIGGDYQGKNPDIPNAKGVYVGELAAINASAMQEGDGGKIIVWGDESTITRGTIKAEGGDLRGDGGFIEISSKGTFSPGGKVSTNAPNGKIGTLLLDPTDVTIDQTTFISMNATAACSAGQCSYTFSGSPATIAFNDLQTFLSTNNVTVDTSNGTGGTGALTFLPSSGFTPIFYSTDLTLITPSGADVTFAASSPSGGFWGNFSSGGLSVQSGGNINFDCEVFSQGPLSFSAAGSLGFANNSNIQSGASTVSISTGGNLLTSNSSGDISIQGQTGLTAFIGGNANLFAGPGASSVTIGSFSNAALFNVIGDLTVTSIPGVTTGISSSGVTDISVGGNINLSGNGGTATISSTGGVTALANGSITLSNNSVINAFVGPVTLAVDYPSFSGKGSFTIDGTSSIFSQNASTGPLLIYTVSAANNKIDPAANFNNATFPPVNGVGQVISGVFFNPAIALPSGATGVPYTIFYEPAPSALQLAQAIGVIFVSGGYTSPTSSSPAVQYITQNATQQYEVMPYPFSAILVDRARPEISSNGTKYLLYSTEETVPGPTEGEQVEEVTFWVIPESSY